jgi:hypothetical protein
VHFDEPRHQPVVADVEHLVARRDERVAPRPDGLDLAVLNEHDAVVHGGAPAELAGDDLLREDRETLAADGAGVHVLSAHSGRGEEQGQGETGDFQHAVVLCYQRWRSRAAS